MYTVRKKILLRQLPEETAESLAEASVVPGRQGGYLWIFNGPRIKWT